LGEVELDGEEKAGQESRRRRVREEKMVGMFMPES
jgi:hypothetical protein